MRSGNPMAVREFLPENAGFAHRKAGRVRLDNDAAVSLLVNAGRAIVDSIGIRRIIVIRWQNIFRLNPLQRLDVGSGRFFPPLNPIKTILFFGQL